MENRKTKIISVVSIIALALTLVTATYAYFAAQTGEGAQTDIKINASTVDTLTFETGSAISLSLDQDNFASGKGNQSGTTFAKAMLSANNKTNTVTEHYNLYLSVDKNTFNYTQDTNTPEILLTIKDGNNTELTSVIGLTYKTVTDGKGNTISGFDITNKNGLITILNNREITTASTTEETWNVTVTFVNYNFNQAENAGKNFNAKLIIQKDEIPTSLSKVCTSGDLLADCIIAYANKSLPSVSGIYHHDANLTNGANDNSYRFSGSSPLNYILINKNYYRIIGVINGRVKLISLATIDNMPWNNSATGTWAQSSVNAYLNDTYLNQLGDLKNNIDTTVWKVGENINHILHSNPYDTYQNEVIKPTDTTTYSAKIGLMYVSDYGFAALSKAWTLSMSDYNDALATKNNWMYLKKNEWTISSLNLSEKYYINAAGGIRENVAPDDSTFSIRPVFYLSSNVKYLGGSGIPRQQPITISY